MLRPVIFKKSTRKVALAGTTIDTKSHDLPAEAIYVHISIKDMSLLLRIRVLVVSQHAGIKHDHYSLYNVHA